MSDANGAVRIGVYVCHCGSNIAGVVGDITFGDANTPQRFLSSVQLHSSPVSDFVFSHVADGMGFTTGLTFLNINPDPASVHMDVFDVNGNLTGSRNFVLEPYQHGPRVLSELVPGFHPQIGGFVHITSDIDIFAFELFLYAPSGQVLSLAAVPPQRGNGTMSGVLTPAMINSSSLMSALKLMKSETSQKYPASLAKGIRMDEQLEFMPMSPQRTPNRLWLWRFFRLRWSVPHTHCRTVGGERAEVQPLSHHRLVLAVPPGAADRAQPPHRRHGRHH